MSEARKREGGGRPNVQRATCIVPAPVGAALCAALLPRSRRGKNAARWLPRFQGGSRGGYRVCWSVFAVATALTSRRLARQFVCRLFSGYSTSAAVRAWRFVSRLFAGHLPVICRARQRARQFGSSAANVRSSAAENAALCFERGKQKAERGKERGTSVRARQTARRFSSSAASGLVYRHG